MSDAIDKLREWKQRQAEADKMMRLLMGLPPAHLHLQNVIKDWLDGNWPAVMYRCQQLHE